MAKQEKESPKGTKSISKSEKRNKRKKVYPTLPAKGTSAKDLIAEMQKRRENDANWQEGKAFSLVYYPGKEYSDMVKEAYNLFFTENALNPTAFKSLRVFEAEVLSMMLDLFGADPGEARGSLTSGGTESILMAVKMAREWGKSKKPSIKNPEIIVPSSAHPAFHKAFKYFGIKPVTIPVTADYLADVEATAAAINKNTVMLVGSAPSYPQGVVDPIEKLSELALAKGLLLHVDSCIGMILPFARELGYSIPPSDFSLPGVTSISCDLHKYGYSPKGASAIMYRNKELRKHQFYVYADWPGGIYASPTMTGTRPGGAIAGAWAALMGIGRDGYLEMTERTMKAHTDLMKEIRNIEGLYIPGKPNSSLLSIASETLDIYFIADELSINGWFFDRQSEPPSIHLTINQIHSPKVLKAFLVDLKKAVKKAKKFNLNKVSANLQVSAFKGLKKVLPGKMFDKLQEVYSNNSPVTSKRTAAMYGMMGELAASGDLEDMVIDFLDKLNSLDG